MPRSCLMQRWNTPVELPGTGFAVGGCPALDLPSFGLVHGENPVFQKFGYGQGPRWGRDHGEDGHQGGFRVGIPWARLSSPRVGDGDSRVRGDVGRIELSNPRVGFRTPRAGLRRSRVVWDMDGLGVRRRLDGQLAQVLEGDAGQDGLPGRGDLGERVCCLICWGT